MRDICNHAGANPGAISYHFGGKRQLYRAVLRRAASDLADTGPVAADENGEAAPLQIREVLRRVFVRTGENQIATRLLLRDLADGGAVAVESLTPPLRNAFKEIANSLGHGDNPRASLESRLLFLDLAAPIFVLTAAWPIVAQALELDIDQREALFERMVGRALESGGEGEEIEARC